MNELFYENLKAFRNQLVNREVQLEADLRETTRILLSVCNEMARIENARKGLK